MDKKIKLVITAITSLFLLAIICSITYALIPKSYLQLQTAPEQVFLSIDGSKGKISINNGDIITISPGKHKIFVQRDEFSAFSQNIDIKNGQKGTIVAALEALTANAQKLLDNTKSSYVIEKATGIKMDKQVKKTIEENPIMNILPINNRYYVISSCASQLYPNKPNKIALCVDIPSDDVKDIVKSEIRSRDFNPDNYEYIWNNYLSGV